jgi:hypothetical protein
MTGVVMRRGTLRPCPGKMCVETDGYEIFVYPLSKASLGLKLR